MILGTPQLNLPYRKSGAGGWPLMARDSVATKSTGRGAACLSQSKKLLYCYYLKEHMSQLNIEEKLVDAETLKTLEKHVPFAWLMSYSAAGALQNMNVLERGISKLQLTNLQYTVYMSNWTAAIIVTLVPLSAVKDPHVREWFDSFYPVPSEEAKDRLRKFPDFPYDGRPVWELYVNRDKEMKDILARSRARIKGMGLSMLGR